MDLGEHLRVVLLSVPEGDDKVAKYPTLFQPADAVLLTKQDLVGVLDWDRAKVYEDLSRLNTRATLIECSQKTGQGMEQWLDWLREQASAACKRRIVGGGLKYPVQSPGDVGTGSGTRR